LQKASSAAPLFNYGALFGRHVRGVLAISSYELYKLLFTKRGESMSKVARAIDSYWGPPTVAACGAREEEMIGASGKLMEVIQQAKVVGPTPSSVLILGETGTGKGRVAKLIHDVSERRNHAFVKVNCAAIPLGLLESELFGHERGAFTGAVAQRIGRFEAAHKGTLFLDEIGDIPAELQPKLLRVLQEHEFERLGSTQTIAPTSG